MNSSKVITSAKMQKNDGWATIINEFLDQMLVTRRFVFFIGYLRRFIFFIGYLRSSHAGGRMECVTYS